MWRFLLGFWNNGFIFKIETFISTHVCLVPVAFSVHERKCDFRITREVHAKQDKLRQGESNLQKKRANSSKILVLDKEVLSLKLT